MVRRIGGLGQLFLAVTAFALMGLSGCGGGGSSGSDGTSPVGGNPIPDPGTNPGPDPIPDPGPDPDPNPGNPPGPGPGDPTDPTDPGTPPDPTPVTVNANGAALTNTRTVVHNLSNAALSGGGWQTTGLLESDNADASSPRVQFDAAGNGFAAWTQGSDSIVRRYTASSATWSGPVILDTRAEDAHQARLAIDRSSGNAIVSWTQNDGVAESVYVSRFNAGTNTWSAAEPVESNSAEVSDGPENSSLYLSGQHAAVAWRQIDGLVHSIYWSRLVGGVWTAPALVDASALEALHPEVAIDASGNASLVWRQRDGNGEFRIHARRWDNATQTFGAVIDNLDTGGDRQPRIGFDAQGNGFALWRGDGIFARRFDVATGLWGAEFTVHNQTGGAWGGELSVDQYGNAMAVWIESDGTATSIYTRRYDAALAAWGGSMLVEDSDDPVDIDYNPTVSLVGSEAVVAWLEDSGTSRDVYASRLSGSTWEEPELLETRPESTDELTSTIDAAGNAAVIWVQPDGLAPSIYQALYLSSNYLVTGGATWQSIASALYGVNSVQAGNALRAAMGGGTLTDGMLLSGFPATLSVTSPVPAFYIVQATDTWSHVAQAVYGTNDVNAIARLQTLLGDPTLFAGQELVVPASFEYLESNDFRAPLNWNLVNTTATETYQLDQAALTVPLDDWSTAQLLESDNAEATSPRVAFDADGNGIAVWAQASDIIVSRYIASNETWSAAEILDANLEEAHEPRLAIDRVTGDATVAWSQSDGAVESLYVSSFDAGTNSWSAAIPLENSAIPVAVSAEYASASRVGGHAAIAWLQSDGTEISVYLSRLVSGTWSLPALIDTDVQQAYQPQVAIDSNGNATVVWRQREVGGGDFRIQSRRWNNVLQSYGSVVELDDEGDRNPRLAFDAQGNAFALWRGGGVFARRFDVTSGQWEPEVQIHAGPGAAFNGEIAVNEAGDALATWVESDGSVNSVYAKYYDAATATWGAATLLENLSTPANVDKDPTVSLVDGVGVVAWVHDNASEDIYAARLSNGVWGSATLLETRPESPQSLVSSIDASDNATVLWVQPNGAADSIYQARSNSTPYYEVPLNATWQSIASVVYGINTAIAGETLQTAMSNPTLTAGLHLQSFPATLIVTPAVPVYYVVQGGDTWASITLALYGTSDAEAAATLQSLLGNPPLTAGAELVIPSILNYSVEADDGG